MVPLYIMSIDLVAQSRQSGPGLVRSREASTASTMWPATRPSVDVLARQALEDQRPHRLHVARGGLDEHLPALLGERDQG